MENKLNVEYYALLAKRIRARDAEAFTEFYNATYNDLYRYVYYFLKHNLPVIEGMASGSTFKEVSGSTMKNVPAIIPDTKTLTCFNDFCAPIFAQQRILEEQNQSLTAIRDGLLPKLISGDLDVSDIDF